MRVADWNFTHPVQEPTKWRDFGADCGQDAVGAKCARLPDTFAALPGLSRSLAIWTPHSAAITLVVCPCGAASRTPRYLTGSSSCLQRPRLDLMGWICPPWTTCCGRTPSATASESHTPAGVLLGIRQGHARMRAAGSACAVRVQPRRQLALRSASHGMRITRTRNLSSKGISSRQCQSRLHL